MLMCRTAGNAAWIAGPSSAEGRVLRRLSIKDYGPQAGQARQ
jgi:hypothetical protein